MKSVPEVDASHDNIEDDLSCIDDEKKDDEQWYQHQHQSSVTWSRVMADEGTKEQWYILSSRGAGCDEE